MKSAKPSCFASLQMGRSRSTDGRRVGSNTASSFSIMDAGAAAVISSDNICTPARVTNGGRVTCSAIVAARDIAKIGIGTSNTRRFID